MNENEFEKQVEQEERAYSEPDQVEFESFTEESSGGANDIIEKIKELVKKGNVTKIVIKKGDNVLVNIPLNVGIVGGIIGVVAAPWAIIAAAVATAGFSCKVELVKESGEVVKVNSESFGQTARDLGEKAKDLGDMARDVGAAVVDGIKDAMQVDDPDIEVEFQEEPEEESPTVEIPVEDGSAEE